MDYFRPKFYIFSYIDGHLWFLTEDFSITTDMTKAGVWIKTKADRVVKRISSWRRGDHIIVREDQIDLYMVMNI